MTGPAVIFDLDDTLIVEESFAMASMREALAVFPDVHPGNSEAVALEAVRSVWRTGPRFDRCVALGFASWEGLWSTFEGNHPSLSGLSDWAPTFRAEAWRAVTDALGVGDPSLAAAAAERFDEAQRRGHPNIEGMEVALDRIRARYPVGMVTNGPSDIQRLKLDQAGLTDAFGAVVISGELGVGKPDPSVFAAVLDQLAARPDGSVMVGDSWERDVRGALAAGLAPVWISAGRPVPEVEPRVTVIESVRELDAVLG